jgi:dolichol-phosphate mannosyltransferase
MVAPTDPLPSFAVVVPAYNEEHGIEACVVAVECVLREMPNRTQLIVVEDGSSDRTSDELARLEQSHPRLTVIRHPANRGYGAALRTGVDEAATQGLDYVLFMDSDLTNDPARLPDFANQMAAGVDVIKATRYSQGGGTAGVPLQRKLPSVVGNAIAHRLYGIPVRDCTNGFRAIKTSLMRDLALHEDSFAVIMEELYRLRPIAKSYAEVPNILGARADHLRPTAFDYRPNALWRYLRYPLLAARDRALGR